MKTWTRLNGVIMVAAATIASTASAEIRTYHSGSIVITADTVANRVTISAPGQTGQIVYDVSAGLVHAMNNGAIVSSEDLNYVLSQSAGGNAYAAESLLTNLRKLAGAPLPKKKISTLQYDPYPCQLSPCPPNYQPPSNPWYLPPYIPNQYQTVEEGGLGDDAGFSEAELRQLDRLMFEQQREQQCDLANSPLGLVAMFSTAVGGVLTCLGALSSGGLATPACYVTGAASLAVTFTWNESAEACRQVYPGYRQW